MFDLNNFVSKEIAIRARDLGLYIDVFYYKSACSPRTWSGCSALVATINITNDLHSKDEVFPFVFKDRGGRQLQHEDIIEQYTAQSGLNISDYIWLPVYLSTKDMLPFYSPNETQGGNIIGFLLKDLSRAGCNLQQLDEADICSLKESMRQELVFLNRWQRGGLISISLRSQQRQEVKRIDNITDKKHITPYLAQVIPQFEERYA